MKGGSDELGGISDGTFDDDDDDGIVIDVLPLSAMQDVELLRKHADSMEADATVRGLISPLPVGECPDLNAGRCGVEDNGASLENGPDATQAKQGSAHDNSTVVDTLARDC